VIRSYSKLVVVVVGAIGVGDVDVVGDGDVFEKS